MAKNKTNKKRAKPKGSAGKKGKPIKKTVKRKLAKKRGTPKKELAKKKPALKKAAGLNPGEMRQPVRALRPPSGNRFGRKARAWIRWHSHRRDPERVPANREICRDYPTSKVRIRRVWPS